VSTSKLDLVHSTAKDLMQNNVGTTDETTSPREVRTLVLVRPLH